MSGIKKKSKSELTIYVIWLLKFGQDKITKDVRNV